MDARARRARHIEAQLRDVLLRDWDPLGVNDVPEAQDEYDSYVGGAYGLLVRGATDEELAEYLVGIERERMGLAPKFANALIVAQVLRVAYTTAAQ